MKRVTVEVKGIVSFMLDDDETLEDKLTEVTLNAISEFKIIDEHDVSDQSLDWAVYYNKRLGTLLQMVLGSGSNIADEDGQYSNGVLVTYDQDIVGSTYRIGDRLGDELLDGKHEVDGACDGELTIDGKPINVEDSESDGDYEAQWVGYKTKMGLLGSKECLSGYLDICGYNCMEIDDWKLVAKG
jgi:hypothetical protein